MSQESISHAVNLSAIHATFRQSALFSLSSPGLKENFCRNPSNSPKGPWCYIANTKEEGQWEYCDMPKCEGKTIIIENGYPIRIGKLAVDSYSLTIVCVLQMQLAVRGSIFFSAKMGKEQQFSNRP